MTVVEPNSQQAEQSHCVTVRTATSITVTPVTVPGSMLLSYACDKQAVNVTLIMVTELS